MTTLLFTYSIIGEDQQPIVNGNLYTSNLDLAKKHVQTVGAPHVAGKSNLEVILRDVGGSVIWRGPYLGNGDA
jgi:hypothetical protein